MKKIILLTMLFLVGCSAPKNEFENVPEKKNIDGVYMSDSSVTTKNLDNYLFRKDTLYVDLRPYSWVMRYGYIAGFSFYPFYDLLAHHSYEGRLFTMGEDLGSIGSYIPNFVESETILYSLFPENKNIFVISTSGDEGCYFLNLLIQYGYDPSKLYNVGGFSNNAGFEYIAYANLDNPKYLVQGNEFLNDNLKVTFDFTKDLTPLNK